MFTIKQVSPTGAESLYEAIEVNYLPAFSDQIERGGVDTVWYTCPGTKEIKSLAGGHVYVTNDTGATVARYNMPRLDPDGNAATGTAPFGVAA